ncbi:hypothetical protein [Microbacterium oleivorans]|uniref:hypothetical protein n=1 Tax=Microbacterium oleivorans TaxID=273677 RepID=UPI0007676E2B|nr:hypothetical protein [Microbacterium oleivorans]
MIGAGIVLLAVGLADLIRLHVSGRRRGAIYVLAVLAVVIGAAGADAAVWAFVAAGVSALWILATRGSTGGRSGLWPLVGVALVTVGAVAFVGVRADQGPLGAVWPVGSPLGAVSLDVGVLVGGALVFLTESGNVVVRSALRGGDVAVDAPTVLKGGRLIGPLERVLVFALTVTGAFTLLAAVLAAKGIVRFPEISRDTDLGTRAEYFLIGSLVSWATALGAAFLLWWGTSA